MAKIDTYFKTVLQNEASDLHLDAGSKPMMRKEGELIALDEKVLSWRELEAMLFELLTEEQKKSFLEKKELDFSYEVANGARFRVNYFMESRVAAVEILFVNHAVANLIREGKTFQIPSFMQTSKNEGTQIMDEEIMKYLQKKIIDPEDAYKKANDKKLLEPFLHFRH